MHQNKDGATPLHSAVYLGATRRLWRFLVEAGADVNAPDKDGATPLHRAAYEGHNKEFLVECMQRTSGSSIGAHAGNKAGVSS